MTTKIVIECDEQSELLQHLTVIRSQIKREFRKNWNVSQGKATKKIRCSDNNCYGTHEVIITLD